MSSGCLRERSPPQPTPLLNWVFVGDSPGHAMAATYSSHPQPHDAYPEPLSCGSISAFGVAPFARRADGSRHPDRHATRHRLGHRGRGRNPNYATSQGAAMDEIGVLRHAFWVASLSRTVSPQAESVHTCADHPLRPHFASQSSSLVHRPPLESREVPISSTHHGSSSHQRPAHAARRAYPLYCL